MAATSTHETSQLLREAVRSKNNVIGNLRREIHACPRTNHWELQRSLDDADRLLEYVLAGLRAQEKLLQLPTLTDLSNGGRAHAHGKLPSTGQDQFTQQLLADELKQTPHIRPKKRRRELDFVNNVQSLRTEEAGPSTKSPRPSETQIQDLTADADVNDTDLATKDGLPPILRPKRHYSEQRWAEIAPDRRRKLSRIAYIEDTAAGMPAPYPCHFCSTFKNPESERVGLVCMVFKPETIKQYIDAKGENWRCCSCCIGRSGKCSFVTHAEAVDRTAAMYSAAEQIASEDNISPVQPVSAQGAPPKRPARFSDPRRRAPADMAPLRRPLKIPAAQSYNWDLVNDDRMRRLSHFGYIQETDAGMIAPKPCMHCSMYRSSDPNFPVVCKIYNPETIGLYS